MRIGSKHGKVGLTADLFHVKKQIVLELRMKNKDSDVTNSVLKILCTVDWKIPKLETYLSPAT